MTTTLKTSITALSAALCWLLLSSLPTDARAACNPPYDMNCCVEVQSNECVQMAEFTVTPEDDQCVYFPNNATSLVITAGVSVYRETTGLMKFTVEKVPDPEIPGAVCEYAKREWEEVTEGDIVCQWSVTGPSNITNCPSIPTSGSGFTAQATVCGVGEYIFNFEFAASGQCVSSPPPVSVTVNVSSVTLDIPDIIGVNDLVPACSDPAGYPSGGVLTPEEFEADDDLKEITWSIGECLKDELDEIYIFGDSRLQVLKKEGENIEINPRFSLTADVTLKVEGLVHSEMPDDAVVTLNAGPYTAQDKATVVQVELDRFCYNRADPFPEVEIVSVEGLTPGGTAAVTYRVVDDMLDSGLPELTDTFTVEEDFGTYEYKTPLYQNRISNTGRDALRYTVYDNDGTKAVRWSHADPDRKAVAALPDLARMKIKVKDALAETPEEAVGHLAPKPTFAGEIVPEGSRPAYEIADVKILAKTPSPAYTNEVHAQVGDEAILQTLHGIARDSAVVLEITGPRVVGVNDRFAEGESASDPGDDAAVDRDISDPDLIELTLTDVPKCVKTGVVSWIVAGDIRLVSVPDAAQVGITITTPFSGGIPPDLLKVCVEGRKASETTDEVTVIAEIAVEDSEENPRAFRGQTLKAEFRLTVTDLRWSGWKDDNEGGRMAERTDMLVCDLDLRPAVLLDHPQGGHVFEQGASLTVSGSVRSMTDIVTDIRVNGETVALSDIRFLGESVGSMTAESVRELTDRPPPYVVTFEHTVGSFSESQVLVEARNGVSERPGFALRRAGYADAGQTITGTLSRRLVTSPAYDLPDMVDFFDGQSGWKFLNKTEVDHCGAGVGTLECGETCGAQPGSGLFRLRLPVVFVSEQGLNSALEAPGLFVRNGLAVPHAAEYHNGMSVGIRKLFAVDLTVQDSSGEVPDTEEWWRGASLSVGATNVQLIVVNPFDQADIPDDAELTLAVEGVDGLPNPYADFQALSWSAETASGIGTPIMLDAPTISGASAFILTLTSEKYGLLAKDRVRVSVVVIDLDIDSDNDNQYSLPDRNDVEEALEDSVGHPGKALALNELDRDKDGVPDFADGYDIDFGAGSQSVPDASAPFVPMILQFPKSIDWNMATVRFVSDAISDPANVRRAGSGTLASPYAYAVTDSGKVRVWTKDGTEARLKASVPSGHAVINNQSMRVSDLNPDTDGIVRLYLEAISPSDVLGDIVIKTELDPDGPGPMLPNVVSDKVKATVFYIQEVHPIAADFAAGHVGKVMISTKQDVNKDTAYYTTGITTLADRRAQTNDAHVTVSAYVLPLPPAGYTNLTVYFEVTDPDDLSHYEGKTVPGTPTVQGDTNANDNRDPTKRMSWSGGQPAGYDTYQTACLSARSAVPLNTVIGGVERCVAETLLDITTRYSGDNYKVRTTMRNPDNQPFDVLSGLTNNVTSSIKASETLIAWKRVYIEQDNMYTLGCTLTADAPAGATNLTVDSTADFAVGDAVVVFWKGGSHNAHIIDKTGHPVVGIAGGGGTGAAAQGRRRRYRCITAVSVASVSPTAAAATLRNRQLQLPEERAPGRRPGRC